MPVNTVTMNALEVKNLRPSEAQLSFKFLKIALHVRRELPLDFLGIGECSLEVRELVDIALKAADITVPQIAKPMTESLFSRASLAR
jgi:hypothetical protein